MGRVYLPAEDLERFGCAADVSGPRDAVGELVRFEAERARAWFAPRAGAAAAARPPQPRLRRRDGRDLPAAAGADRRRPDRRPRPADVAADLGEGAGRGPEPRGSPPVSRRRGRPRRTGRRGRRWARRPRRRARAARTAAPTVTLLERRPRLGGATWSFEHHGLHFDNGQHVFLRCCTAYRRFLDRIGAADRVVLQDRLDVPVVAPGGRVAHLRRDPLPAPLHLGRALLGYPHLPVRRPGRPRAAPRSRCSGSTRPIPRSTPSTFGEWLAATGQSAGAIDKVWNLIALADAQRRRPTKPRSRSRRWSSRPACCPTPSAGRHRMVAGAARRTCTPSRRGARWQRAACEVRTGARVDGIETDRRDGGAGVVEAVMVDGERHRRRRRRRRRAPRRRRARCSLRALADGHGDGPGSPRDVADRQRPPRVRPAGHGLPVRRGRRVAGAVRLRPDGVGGHGSGRRAVRVDLAVGRRPLHRTTARATSSAGSRSRWPDSSRRARARASSTPWSRASRRPRSAPARNAALRAGDAHGRRRSLPRRRVDRHRVAGDDGRRGAQRRGRRARPSPRSPARRGRPMPSSPMPSARCRSRRSWRDPYRARRARPSREYTEPALRDAVRRLQPTAAAGGPLPPGVGRRGGEPDVGRRRQGHPAGAGDPLGGGDGRARVGRRAGRGRGRAGPQLLAAPRRRHRRRPRAPAPPDRVGAVRHRRGDHRRRRAPHARDAGAARVGHVGRDTRCVRAGHGRPTR